MKVELLNTASLLDARAAPAPPVRDQSADFKAKLGEATSHRERSLDRSEDAVPTERQEDDSTNGDVERVDVASGDDDLSAAPDGSEAQALVASVEVAVSSMTVDTEVALAGADDVTAAIVHDAEGLVTGGAAVLTDTGTVSSGDGQDPELLTNAEAVAEAEPGLAGKSDDSARAIESTATNATTKTAPESSANASDAAGRSVTTKAIEHVESTDGSGSTAAPVELGSYFKTSAKPTSDNSASTSSFHLLDADSDASSDCAEPASQSRVQATRLDVVTSATVASATSGDGRIDSPAPMRLGTPTRSPEPVTALPTNATEVASADGGRADSVRPPAAPPAEATIRAERGDEKHLARRVYRVLRNAVRRGESSLKIRLDPPQLGRIDVDVELGEKLRVNMAVDSSEVRAILHEHIEELQAVLDQYGEAGGEVSIDLRQQRDGGSDGQQSQRGLPSAPPALSESATRDISLREACGPAHLGQSIDTRM